MKKKHKIYILIVLIFIIASITICFIPIGISRFIPIVEKQFKEELGVQVHLQKLILRVGPSLKIKAPVMHIMYDDGNKFAQFDNVRFVIPYSAFFKKNTVVKKIYANRLIVKVDSEDVKFKELITRLQEKSVHEFPIINLKNYNIVYSDRVYGKPLKLDGSNFEAARVKNFNSIKVKSQGDFYIGSKKYINYDVSILPEGDFEFKQNGNFYEILEQIEALDFHSDIIADLKLYNKYNNQVNVSGLVNIDNISVLDYARKCPKSFIYLTFLGEKVGILSNIYTSQDKKVYIDGVFNNSKKNGIDIKVKTDNISLAELYKKIKLIIDCSRIKGIEAVSGTMSADFTVKGNLNKLKSTGFINVADALVKINGVDISKINANIDLSNNAINIIDSTGYVNNAPIMVKGKIDKDINLDFLMNKVELKNLLPSKYGIESGIVSLVAKVTGKFDKIVHKENVQVDDLILKNEENTLSFASLRYDSNKNNIAYINDFLIKLKGVSNIKAPQIKIQVEPEFLKISPCNLFMQNSKLILVSELNNYQGKEPSFSLNIDGEVSAKDIEFLKQYSDIYPIKLRLFGNKNIQNINSQLLFENAIFLSEPSLLNLVGKISDKNLKIEELALYSFNDKFSDDLKLNLKGNKKVLITGGIDNINKPELKNVRLFIPQFLNLHIFDTVLSAKGDLFLNGDVFNPDIVGQLTLQNIVNQYMQLAVNSFVIDFNKNTAHINVPTIKIGDSALSLIATIATDFSKELKIKNLNLKSKYINTDTFLTYKDLPQFSTMPIAIEKGKLYAEKVHSTLYGTPIVLTTLSSDLSLKDNILTLENILSELYNGQLAGKIEFNLRDERFISKIQTRSVSAAPIFNIISNRKETISGIVDFDSTLSGELSSKENLNGDIKFVVSNGRMSSLGKLEHLLYAQNVIADNMLRTSLSVVTKAITLKDTGLFKSLRGEVQLQNGLANIKFLQSQGPLMSLFIKGTYNVNNDDGKLVVLGRISDEIISGLGVFGEFSWNKLKIMLTGEEENSNIHPEDYDKIPQLPVRNTKEFRSIINGNINNPSSVVLFNWISYSKKSYRQTEVPDTNTKIPEFIEALPY